MSLLDLVLDLGEAAFRAIMHYEAPAYGGNDYTDIEKEAWTEGYNHGFGNGFKNGAHKDDE